MENFEEAAAITLETRYIHLPVGYQMRGTSCPDPRAPETLVVRYAELLWKEGEGTYPTDYRIAPNITKVIYELTMTTEKCALSKK